MKTFSHISRFICVRVKSTGTSASCSNGHAPFKHFRLAVARAELREAARSAAELWRRHRQDYNGAHLSEWTLNRRRFFVRGNAFTNALRHTSKLFAQKFS